jgi:antitoxin component HigA of HigAB toxin-antitoxin module
MDVNIIAIDNDAELSRARAFVDELMESDSPSDIVRLQAQARLIEAYEEGRWVRRRPSTAELVAFLMDQHSPPNG